MGGFDPGRITTAGDRNGRPGTQLKADGRCSFGIETISLGVRIVRVEEHERLAFQFGSLTEFAGEQNGRRVLLVAPLAGAYPMLLRDLLVGLLRHATVAVTDWRDARYVPQSAGAFGLAENIGCVLAMMLARCCLAASLCAAAAACMVACAALAVPVRYTA